MSMLDRAMNAVLLAADVLSSFITAQLGGLPSRFNLSDVLEAIRLALKALAEINF